MAVVTVVLVGIVGLIGIHASKQTGDIYTDLEGNFLPITKLNTNITGYAKRAEAQLLLYLLTGNQTNSDKFHERIDLLKQTLESLEKIVSTQKYKEEVQIMLEQTANALKLGNELITEYKKNPQVFNPKAHIELLKSFHAITIDIRRKGVKLAKVSRVLFQNQLLLNLNTEVTSYSKRAEGYILMYFLLGNHVDRMKFYQRIETLTGILKDVKATVTISNERDIVNVMLEQTANALKFGNQLLKEYDNNSNVLDVKHHTKLINNLHSAISDVREKGQVLAKLKADAINKEINSITNTTQNIQNYLIGIICLVLLLSIILSFFISSPIIKSINILKNAIDNVCKGTLDKEINISSTDEIGNLALDFEKMRRSLLDKKKSDLKATKIALDEKNAIIEQARIFEKDATSKFQKTFIELKNATLTINKTERVAQSMIDDLTIPLNLINDIYQVIKEDNNRADLDYNIERFLIQADTLKEIVKHIVENTSQLTKSST